MENLETRSPLLDLLLKSESWLPPAPSYPHGIITLAMSYDFKAVTSEENRMGREQEHGKPRQEFVKVEQFK